MKKLNYYKLLIIPAIILFALLTSFCTQRESQIDSTQVAEEKNKEKFTTKDAQKDAEIVTGAAAASLAQIRLAELALEKSRDEEIKQVAQLIKDDHSKLLADLKEYAALRVITLPLTESGKVRKNIEKLGVETELFNKKWCEEMKSQNKESIHALDQAQKDVTDAELKSWIAIALPKYRQNLDKVSACHNRVK